MNVQQKMLFEERNGSAYSERLANQIQMKLDNAPFKPHNFKLAYDLDAFEAANEKLQKRNTPHNTNPATPSKLQFKILSDSQNSRMFFEAMKLSNLRKQAQKQKQIEINNKNSSSPFQTSGKFYHLNFEPMRIEDYRELDESKINEDLSEIPNKMKLQKILNDQHAINNNNVYNYNYNNSNNSNNNSSSNNNYYYNNNDESCKNLDSRNNNDINSVDLCRNANNSYYNNNNCNANTNNNNNNINDDNNNMTYNNNYQKIICSNNCNYNSNNTLSLPKNMTNDDENKNHINNKPNNINNNNIINNRTLHYSSKNNNINPYAKSTPQIQQTNERKNMTKENMAKPPRAGQGRKLPNLPKTQQNNVSRLSSVMPDLIATTKAPSIADEIMAVYNREKQALKKDFIFPTCCSPKELFGLEKSNINPDNVRLTIDDLGYPDTVDPIKKYADLYLNEMYVRSIICFLASMTEDMYKRLHDDEDGGSDGEGDAKEKSESKEEKFVEDDSKETYPISNSPVEIELKIDKTSLISSSSSSLHASRQNSELESEPFTPDSLSTFVNPSAARLSFNETPRKSRKSSASLESGFDETKRDGSTCSRATDCQSVMSTHSHHSDGSDGSSSHFPPGFTDIEFYLDESDATHRGCHKFLPRHDEEIAVEIGDNLYVEKEHDDLWCEGINLRTKKRGIFPTAYATDLSLMGDAPKVKYFVSFLGSIEIGQHNGHDILCKAIKKIISSKNKQKDAPLNLSCLEIDENGVKVSERKKKTPTSRILSSLGKLSLLKNLQENEHVFLLKNITFCGILPSNDKYMGFITKHPVCMKFACHVFLASNSARPIVEAIGGALSRFHQEFLTVVYPVEDIYFE